MNKKHLAVYGITQIPRAYCKKCKGIALIVDGKFACCDRKFLEQADIKQYKIICETGESRKKPSAEECKRILELQNNKCLYCDKPFGTPYYKDNRVRMTKLHFDHLVPYSYTKSNKLTFVAACNICNLIKSNRVFNTVEEVYHYVQYRRKKKNIFYYEDLPPMPEEVS